MIKKIILSSTLFMFLGNFIPCFTKNNDTKSSSEIKGSGAKNRSKKIGKTKYPKSKQKSVVSKIGILLKDTYEAISQTDNSVSSSTQKHNYYSEGPLPDDYEPEGLKDVLPSQNNALNIQENKAQSSQNTPITDILVPDSQQEEYPAQIQQSIVHIEPVLDNKPLEQQEINIIPSKQTVKQEPTIQQPAESQQNKDIGSQSNTPQSSGPTLARELYDGTGWVLEKTCKGIVRGYQKVAEITEQFRDKVDELRVGLEEKQRREREKLRLQRAKETYERVQAEQQAKTQKLDVPVKQEFKTTLSDQDSPYEALAKNDTPLESTNVVIENYNKEENKNIDDHKFLKQDDDIQQEQVQDIPISSEIPNSNTLSQIDIHGNQEQQNTEQKVIESKLPEIRPEDIVPESTKNKIVDVQKQQMQQDWSELTETWSEKPKDEKLTDYQGKISTNIGKIDTNIQKEAELFKLLGVSFDKTQLIFFGAGVAATVVICGITYVLYKNKDKLKLEKAGNYVKEHKFAISGIISAVCALVVIGGYAKQQGMTLQSVSNWIISFLGGKESVYN